MLVSHRPLPSDEPVIRIHAIPSKKRILTVAFAGILNLFNVASGLVLGPGMVFWALTCASPAGAALGFIPTFWEAYNKYVEEQKLLKEAEENLKNLFTADETLFNYCSAQCNEIISEFKENKGEAISEYRKTFVNTVRAELTTSISKLIERADSCKQEHSGYKGLLDKCNALKEQLKKVERQDKEEKRPIEPSQHKPSLTSSNVQEEKSILPENRIYKAIKRLSSFVAGGGTILGIACGCLAIMGMALTWPVWAVIGGISLIGGLIYSIYDMCLVRSQDKAIAKLNGKNETYKSNKEGSEKDKCELELNIKNARDAEKAAKAQAKSDEKNAKLVKDKAELEKKNETLVKENAELKIELAHKPSSSILSSLVGFFGCRRRPSFRPVCAAAKNTPQTIPHIPNP